MKQTAKSKIEAKIKILERRLDNATTKQGEKIEMELGQLQYQLRKMTGE